MISDDAPLLNDWRQGDLALIPIELAVLMPDGEKMSYTAVDALSGVVVLTQSCDIIKDVENRPYVQVAGLIRSNEGEIARAIRRETPSRVHLNCLLDQGLLIDLDVSATVHKSVVANWPRTAGCSSDGEQRSLAASLARYRHRFAFPDQFNDLIRPIRRWIESKRQKASPQGNFVRAMQEIRVHCDNWEAPTELTFFVIVNHIPDAAEMSQWEDAAKSLQSKVAADSYPPGEFLIVTYDNISAREYLESDRLDWDGLSDAP